MSSSDNLKKLCEGNQSFLSDLYKTILKGEPDDNIFFSPISISLALSMALVGARENTLQQMKKTLCYDNLEDDQIHESFKNLLNQLTDKNQGSVSIANGLFVQNDFQLLQPFINTVQEMYNAVTKNMDFKNNPVESALELNNWVKEATREKIPQLLEDVDPEMMLCIVNAIYFKGLWMNKFDPNSTKLSPFYLNENEKVQVKMMCLFKKFRHTVNEDADCEVLELPYRDGNTSMIIFLPNEVNGLSKIESIISAEFISSCLSSAQHTCEWPVILELPSFTLEQSYSLAPILRSMGMTDAFHPFTANLQGISQEEGLYISEVIHKSVVEVNEEGTEAAAATAVRKQAKSEMEPIRFIVDHPFLFSIVDMSTNNVHFIGSLKKPQTV